jgi:hypothetical protein
MAYATPEDYAAFDPSSQMEDTELEPLLATAQKDIDWALGLYGRDVDTGDKINVEMLTAWRAAALAWAVCAQAQYHLFKGEEFFASLRPLRQSSREGSIEGQEPFISPRASAELTRANFYRLTSGKGSRDLYDLPNQNTGS